MDERSQIERAIAEQERLRGTVPDSVIDTTIAILRERLAATETRGAARRKHVTALFADVTGFTALAEALDAEEVADLFEVVWARLDRIITDHGGRIDKHIGDAVMALWGADVTREEDAENAVRAALAMGVAIGQVAEETGHAGRFDVHIGINTGPVLLGHVATTAEFTAMGDTVNVASRLEEVAPPGGILIGHDTYRHVRGVFSVSEQQPLTVKGKREPLRTYLVTGTRPRAFRVAARGVEGIETRMVGRDAELALLQQAMAHAIEHRRGRVVIVVGDAGLGKSRLLFELIDWLELQRDDVLLLQARMDATHAATPYALIRELLFFRFEISENDDWAVDKLVAGFAELGGLDVAAAHFVAHLIGIDVSTSAHVSGLVEDPRQLRDRGSQAVLDLVQAMADRLPVLVLLEDVQWADQASLDLIDELGVDVDERALVMVATARPSLFDRRADWGAGSARIELGPLTAEASAAQVTDVLRLADDVPAQMRDAIVTAAEGNPFYVEELVKSLIEDGTIVVDDDVWHVETARTATLRVPPTLTAVIQARLDRLPPAERVVLQRASVVGRVFWDHAVASELAVDTAPLDASAELDRLVRRELIHRNPDSAFPGAREYTFKHAMVRDVTYDSVLKKVRGVYHRAVAAWLVGQAETEIRAPLIARHLEAAGDDGDAAHWYVRAGHQARRRYANADALSQYAKALELGGLSDRDRFEALEGSGDVLALLARYDEALDAYGTMLAAARDAEDIAAQATALNAIAFVEPRHGSLDVAMEAANEAVALLQGMDEPDGKLLSEALRGAGWLRLRQGDSEAARRLAEEAREYALDAGDDVGLSRSLNLLSLAASTVGDFDVAEACMIEALAVDRRIGDRRGEGSSLINLGEAARRRGDAATAAERYREALAIQRELGDRDLEGLSLSNLGGALVGLGRYDEALASLRAALEVFDAAGSSEHRSETMRFMAEAWLAMGEVSRALATALESLADGQVSGRSDHIGHAWRVLGRVAAAMGEPLVVAGEPCDVDECFKSSVAALRDDAIDRALALADWSRAVAGDEERSHTLWRDAMAILEPLGLGRLAATPPPAGASK